MFPYYKKKVLLCIYHRADLNLHTMFARFYIVRLRMKLRGRGLAHELHGTIMLF